MELKLLPKIKVEVVVCEVPVENVIEVCEKVLRTGEIGDGKIFIYYASSDTRMHVAVSTLDVLVDYCRNTPEDGLRSTASVAKINELIDKNKKYKEGII